MGFWSIFSSPSVDSPDVRATSVRSGAAVPTRAERQRCWTSRDALFTCLDKHSVVDVTAPPGSEIGAKECGAELEGMERDCAAEWVRYFKMWRVAEIKKKQQLDQLKRQGAVAMDVTTTFASKGK